MMTTSMNDERVQLYTVQLYRCTLYSVQLYTAFMYTTDGIYLQYNKYENGTANLLLIYC